MRRMRLWVPWYDRTRYLKYRSTLREKNVIMWQSRSVKRRGTRRGWTGSAGASPEGTEQSYDCGGDNIINLKNNDHENRRMVTSSWIIHQSIPKDFDSSTPRVLPIVFVFPIFIGDGCNLRAPACKATPRTSRSYRSSDQMILIRCKYSHLGPQRTLLPNIL